MKYSKNLLLLSSLFALSTGVWAENEKVLVAYFPGHLPTTLKQWLNTLQKKPAENSLK